MQRSIPEYSIFNIFNLGSKKQIELYKQGIVNIQDIPDTFTMTDKQMIGGENDNPRADRKKTVNF